MSRVYIVDEHTIVRAGLRALLEAHAHRVVGEAAEPHTAIAELLRLQPEVALVELDLGAHSGFDVLAALQRHRVPTHSIVLTQSAQARDVARALKLGAGGYLLKRGEPDELLAAIRGVLRGQRPLGVDVADLALDALSHDDPLAALSTREHQILALVVRGRSSAQIARQLSLSPKTVDTYRSRLMKKLAAPDLPALVRFAVRVGLVQE